MPASQSTPSLSGSPDAPLRPFEATSLPAGPILRTFFNIARAWRLTRPQAMVLLGMQSVSTYSAWKRNPDAARLRPDTIERLSYVFGIHAALHTWLADKNVADSWISQPNTDRLFGGRPAIERMTTGRVTDLARVRAYLDAIVHTGR